MRSLPASRLPWSPQWPVSGSRFRRCSPTTGSTRASRKSTPTCASSWMSSLRASPNSTRTDGEVDVRLRRGTRGLRRNQHHADAGSRLCAPGDLHHYDDRIGRGDQGESSEGERGSIDRQAEDQGDFNHGRWHHLPQYFPGDARGAGKSAAPVQGAGSELAGDHQSGCHDSIPESRRSPRPHGKTGNFPARARDAAAGQVAYGAANMTTARARQRGILSGVVAVASMVALGLLFLYVRSMLANKPQSEKRVVPVVVKIIRPPEPPPEPPPPPPPEKIEEQIPKDTPDKPIEQAPESAQLGVDAQGTAGGDSFGLVGNAGGRDLVGSGSGPFVYYANLVKDIVQDALSNVERAYRG